MRTVDLRLVPAAVLAWAAAWTATGGVGVPVLAHACGWLAGLAGAGMLLLAGLRGTRRGRGADGEGSASRGVASAAANVALVAASSLGVVAVATVTAARAAPIEDLARSGFTAELTGTVASQPEPVSWGPAPPGGTGTADLDAAGRRAAGPLRFMLDVREVTARGVTAAARARVMVTVTPSDGRGGGASGTGAPELRFGATVEARGALGPADPGDPEAARLVTDVVTVERSPPPPLRWLDRHRDALMAVTADLAPQARGLVPGAAIGDTTRLPDELAEAMKQSGLTHITAVSGGHFAIVIALLTGVAGTLGAPRWARVALLAVAGAAFVALVRPEPSVLRAAVMTGFALAGIVLGRPAQSVPALAGTVIGLLVADPGLSRSFGFALSAAATAGLVLLVPPLVARIAPWTGHAFAFALAVPLAAQVACAPVLVLLEPEVSVVSVPANLLATPALVPATLLGLAATALAPWWSWGAHLVAWAAGGATWWIAQVALHAAAVPGRALPWLGGPVGAVLLAGATGAMLALTLRWHPRGWPDSWRRSARSQLRRVSEAPGGGSGAKALAGFVIAGVVLGAVALAVPRVAGRSAVPEDWVVAACDVGQGDGLAVRTGPSSAVVVDVGPDGDAAGRCLDRLGVTRVDLLVLSHFHADHVGGLAAVLDGRRVESALVSPLPEPEANAAWVLDALETAGVPAHVPVAGERGRAGSVTWDVLLAGIPGAGGGTAAPGGAAASGAGANDASVTLLVRVAGLDVMLLGDLEEAGQAAVLAQARSRGIADVDVVKVAHHGSRVQSRALAEQLRPAAALFSVGDDNGYGHPTDSALGLYAGVGAVVLRTDECGTFALVVRDGALAVGGC